MLNALSDAALVVGGSLELSIVVKATLVAALGLVAIGVSRRARASRRYLVIAATFAVLLALPLAILVAPPVGVPVASAKPAASALVSGAPLGTQANTLAAEAAESPVHPTVSQDSGSAWSVSPIALLRGIWILGAALFLLPMVVIAWQAGGLRRTGLPWLHAGALAERLARAAGLRRRVAVLLHENVDAPMTCGLWRPVILLPRDAQTWSQDDLQRALLHELEHVRRADWLALLAARATCALYWFHPLVWMAWRRLHLEAERACDDAVAVRTDRSAYAEQLVALAGRLTPESARPVLAMAGRGDLSHRVRAVLDDRRTRGRAGAACGAGIVAAAAMALIAISPLRAVSAPQVQTPEAQSFEVAAVRPNRSGGRGGFTNYSPAGRFTITNQPLANIIRLAYGIGPISVRPFATVRGEPSWITDRFDIVASAPAGTPPLRSTELGPIHAMLQSLLAERFKLAVHWETQEVPTFDLVLARSDGRLGPQLRPSTVDCEAARVTAPADADRAAERERLRRALATGDASLLPPLPPPVCGTRSGGGEIQIGTQPLKALVEALARRLDRPVVDRTGLTGNFDVHLTWAPDRTAPAAQPADGPPFQGIPVPVASDPAGPPLADALRDQLGLRLEPGRGPVEILVIDRVERPTPD